MSSELGQALAATVYIAVAVAFLYGTYWALAIREALAGRIYRNHALWLGAFSIVVLVAVEPLAALVSSPSNPMIFVLSFFPVSLATLVAFAFGDSTVPVACRSDSRLRELLGWKKARVVTWSALLAILALAFSLGAAEGFSTSGTAFNILFIVPLPILALVGGGGQCCLSQKAGRIPPTFGQASSGWELGSFICSGHS